MVVNDAFSILHELSHCKLVEFGQEPVKLLPVNSYCIRCMLHSFLCKNIIFSHLSCIILQQLQISISNSQLILHKSRQSMALILVHIFPCFTTSFVAIQPSTSISPIHCNVLVCMLYSISKSSSISILSSNSS